MGVPDGQQQDEDPRVARLLATMTLEEKIGQMSQFTFTAEGQLPEGVAGTLPERAAGGDVGSVLNVIEARSLNALQRRAIEESRSRIPILFAYDTIHGFTTIFPIPLAQAASFDPALVESTSMIAGRETRAAGIRMTFAPMVDIARDPRWGRIAEGAGEDPNLGAAMAEAQIRGYHAAGILTTAKHFVAYGKVEAGREYNTVDLSERALREVYLPPFEAAVRAGVDSIMTAFNDLNGVPMVMNRALLGDELRGRMGFGGFVVSDYTAIRELVQHQVAEDEAHAAMLSASAGVDMDMQSGAYLHFLADEVEQGRVDVQTIDDAVRRILRAKVAAGLFDAPYADQAEASAVQLAPEHRMQALEVARRSIVLLKNEGDILPLGGARKLAVVGPLADSAQDTLGSWHGVGRAEDAVSILAGLRNRAASRQVEVSAARGAELDHDVADAKQIAEAVRVAQGADVVVAVVGESAAMTGEAASRAHLDLPGNQQALLEAMEATGKPLVVVLMNGRPLTVPWIAAHARAVVEAWQLGTEMGNAVADVLFGAVNPGGKLPVTFPRDIGQIPIHYDSRSTGRPVGSAAPPWVSQYTDIENTPQWPFGFGLSYTRFEITGSVEPPSIGKEESLRVSATVRNTGARAGDEVVQVYIGRAAASVTQPVKRLLRFQRITLQPGESRSIDFLVSAEELALYDADMKRVVEPGTFRLWVAESSAEGEPLTFEVLDSGAQGRGMASRQ